MGANRRDGLRPRSLASAAAVALIVRLRSRPRGIGDADAGSGRADPAEAVFVEPDEKGRSCGSRTRSATARTARWRCFPARPPSTATETATRRTTATPPADLRRHQRQRRLRGRPRWSRLRASLRLPRYHPAHNHWHVLDIARYELRREDSGKLLAQSRKVGFCFTDTRVAFPSAFTDDRDLSDRLGEAIGCDATSTRGSRPAGRTSTRSPCPASSWVEGCREAGTAQLVRRSARSDRRAQRGQQRAPVRPSLRPRKLECARFRAPAGSDAYSPLAASWGATSTGSPPRCQWASGDGGVSRRYHSASSAPMQPGARGGDRLAVGAVDEVADREHPGEVRARRAAVGEHVALVVEVDLLGHELRRGMWPIATNAPPRAPPWRRCRRCGS